MNYYNENDPKAAAWLRELIKARLIPAGEVDERSITDVQGADLAGFVQCHWFAGIGGWAYALHLAGWPEDRPVWTGSCPCQPFTGHGQTKGAADVRHLWPYWFPLVREHKPSIIFGEQSEKAIGFKWLDEVACDCEGEGYSIGAAVLPASAFGFRQRRKRLFWVAAHSGGKRGKRLQRESLPAGSIGQGGACSEADLHKIYKSPFEPGESWPQPLVRQMDDGVSEAVGLLRGYGNAIVPQLAAEFIQAYIETLI